MPTATECNAKELVILVDEQNNEVGTAEKLLAHEKNLLHRAFSVFIFRNLPHQSMPAELLIQQRALHKYHTGGLWTNSCCSHPRPGETIIAAGERRITEELGINTSLRDLGWFHYNAHFANGLSENEIDHVLVGMIDQKTSILVNPEEVQAYRFIPLAELKQELNEFPEQFTPWFAQALAVCIANMKNL